MLFFPGRGSLFLNQPAVSGLVEGVSVGRVCWWGWESSFVEEFQAPSQGLLKGAVNVRFPAYTAPHLVFAALIEGFEGELVCAFGDQASPERLLDEAGIPALDFGQDVPTRTIPTRSPDAHRCGVEGSFAVVADGCEVELDHPAAIR